ncbi:hypothetical protein [Mesorhizobium sp. M0071]|uniref:hypothetical protein n=1 Tax=Mesorhizobium sp. M0071 TaxID=2956868 RepID=UPI003338824F
MNRAAIGTQGRTADSPAEMPAARIRSRPRNLGSHHMARDDCPGLGTDVTYRVARRDRGCRNVGSGAGSESLPGKTRKGTARDKEDHGEQQSKLSRRNFHVFNIAQLRVATLTQINAAAPGERLVHRVSFDTDRMISQFLP